MRIAFYSPLKSPDHPVPSGDRLMARQLMKCLELSGAKVELASRFRSFVGDSGSSQFEAIRQESQQQIEAISRSWECEGIPDLWFCYHPYYKAPDLLGPPLCRHFDIPYVTAETSYSRRRNIGSWTAAQACVLDGISLARVNICMTARDLRGIAEIAPSAATEALSPFIDTGPFSSSSHSGRNRLIAVAMMRAGDKFESYRFLARSLSEVTDQNWTLTIIGDGPLRGEVETLFAEIPRERIIWKGQLDTEAIARELALASIFLWPGYGEAYGLAYLEAQACGLPVVALNVAGVPEVVMNGQTGILCEPDDTGAFANAVETLLRDSGRRDDMARNARAFVIGNRNLEGGARALAAILEKHGLKLNEH